MARRPSRKNFVHTPEFTRCTEDARRLFEHLLTLRNDVGLLSEQYDPQRRRQVGNFPQAFSHLALVNTASNLSHYRKPAQQRSDRPVVEKAAGHVDAR